MRTQDQERAQHAYTQVQNITDERQKAKFKTLALKFPAMVQQCGLLQTLAFCEQKNIEVYNAITGWLAQQQILTPQAQNQQGNETFFQRVCREEQLGPYRLLSREALAYGTWLKRAVEVLLKDVRAED
jgi:CRISPR type III-B/RAMP module-associated protein Cmr5|uniref:CRISPR type III-B/RAMP module-associated protein Cmr5 n=1 Tax=Desulfobacca acetoxidans TaxID=60893 RepID=A0A7V6DQ49_9BACT